MKLLENASCDTLAQLKFALYEHVSRLNQEPTEAAALANKLFEILYGSPQE